MEPLKSPRTALTALRAPPAQAIKSTKSIKNLAKRKRAPSMMVVMRKGGEIERKENGREPTQNDIL